MNSQFSVAVHILALVNDAHATLGDPALSSDFIAGSVGVNPVVIRTVTGLLRRAGLIATRRGVSGAQLTRPAEQITLLEVYRAVNAPGAVLKLHPRPNPHCTVGANIQSVLDQVFRQAQAALEGQLEHVTLADITRAVNRHAS